MGGLNVIETGNESKTIHKLWVRGGFPDSYLAANDVMAMDWLEDLIRTYLERDLPQLGFVYQPSGCVACGPCWLIYRGSR
jgi:uncharacterized protein